MKLEGVGNTKGGKEEGLEPELFLSLTAACG